MRAPVQSARLIFYSRPRPDTDTAAIVEQGRRINARDGLRACLLATGGWFIEILEGPHGPVVDAFGRIRKDERHVQVSLLDLSLVAGPLLPDEPMALVTCDDGDPVLREHGIVGALNPIRLKPDEALTIMLGLFRASALPSRA